MLKTSVMDTGVGIKPEQMEQLFRFFGKINCKNMNQSGMGFGLTISQMIAKQLRGSIKVESVY
jgi:K+-sensing histidine kinase KdpD